MNIGQRVREAREALGMQRTVLARRVGVAENTIYRIETAKRTPSVELLEKIARELRTEPAEFLREPALSGGKAEALDTGPARSYREVAGKLQAIREGFREELDSFERNIARWEQLRKGSGFSKEALREFLLTSESYFRALIGLARDELTAIVRVLYVEAGFEVGDSLPDEAVRESSLMPLLVRFAALLEALSGVWDELVQADSELPKSADIVNIEELRAMRRGVGLSPRRPQKTG
jgi:transcriptional regulator with XRE-family HTH domain